MQQKEPKVCKKCKTSKPSIIVQKDPVCTQCFIEHVEHMFKMTLRLKCKITQKNEKILICFSGGQYPINLFRNSTALTKLASDVAHSTCAQNKSKMFILADVLYINEDFIKKEFIEDYKSQDYSKFVTSECKLSFQEIKLESLYEDPSTLVKQLYDLPDYGSAREDFITYLKLHIIYDYAISNGYQYISFGQNGQRLAADLFSQLSKGRGLSLESATKFNFILTHPKNGSQLQILHPLKELLNRDILYYLKLKSNDNFPTFTLGQNISVNVKNKQCNGNIKILLEQFIDKLQDGFPSTTFTVLSSAEKATFKPLDRQYSCPLCLQIRDNVYNKLEVETLDNSNQKLIQYLSSETKYYQIICFTCKRMFQNSKNIEKFYNFIGFPKMLSEIAECILAKEKGNIIQQQQIEL